MSQLESLRIFKIRIFLVLSQFKSINFVTFSVFSFFIFFQLFHIFFPSLPLKSNGLKKTRATFSLWIKILERYGRTLSKVDNEAGAVLYIKV